MIDVGQRHLVGVAAADVVIRARLEGSVVVSKIHAQVAAIVDQNSVQLIVAIHIAQGNVARIADRGIVGRQGKDAVGTAHENAEAGTIVACNHKVWVAVTIEISRSHCLRSAADGVSSGVRENTVARAEQDGQIAAAIARHGQIRDAIVIEIRRGEVPGIAEA